MSILIISIYKYVGKGLNTLEVMTPSRQNLSSRKENYLSLPLIHDVRDNTSRKTLYEVLILNKT